jgi:hypothetical protein
MTVKPALVLCLWAAVAFGLAFAAQPEPAIGVSVLAASQPEAPLQVYGFEESPKPVRHMVVLVRNVTNKPISEFEISAAVKGPCSDKEDGTAWHVGLRLEPTAVGPNSVGRSTENVAALGWLLSIAKSAKATYLHVQVGVRTVKFRDGTIWQNKFTDTSDLFTQSLIQSDSRKCENWPTPGSALEQLLPEVSVVQDESASALEIRPNGYFLTCVLRNRRALCPVD